MNHHLPRHFTLAVAAAVLGAFAAPAHAQDGQPTSPEALLERVKSIAKEQTERDQQRLREFRSARDRQEQLLREQQQRLANLEQKAEALEKEFADNEKKVGELTETLRVKQGDRGELFGVARQMAGDLRAQLEASLISAQYPGRADELAPIAQSTDVPTIDELQTLWIAFQEEMTRSGNVVAFDAEIIDGNGATVKTEVVRVGPFTAVSDGAYLVYNAEEDILVELGRQPAGRYLESAQRLANADSGFVQAAVDPSMGSILSLLVETPSFAERLSFGGAIGYIVITLGIIAFLFGIVKLILLGVSGLKVRSQLKSDALKENNPLGRVLKLSQTLNTDELEAYEAKIDEAVLREGARLESGIWLVKVVQVAAPLLGLLGTVTGMINTFQAITLFGTGDPRLMAGGISEALVTTMLGLMVAIPLVLLSSTLSNIAKRILDVLDEQAAGMIADRRPVGESHAVAE